MSPSSTSTASSRTQNVVRQLRFILPGAAVSYYFSPFHELYKILVPHESGSNGWGRFTALSGVGLGITTLLLFLYVILVPLLRGLELDYSGWRQDDVLSSAIPILTSTIILGWLLLVVTLGQWSSLGYAQGILSATATYALMFGLLGLIPSVKPRRLHD
ncbi:hypothetical protein FISHEDRAFT_51754 [Fistulina hepatica ATCC 64428]|nr:hypothetical protein FISHEDRAFT_51754 [Fistulina hepatica ATCC 64428]